MAKTKRGVAVYIDPVANTFNIWWDNPKKAYSSEEVSSPFRSDVIVKDKNGRPISLEIMGLFPKELNITEQISTRDKDKPFLLRATS